MTRDEILARYPNASADFIARNLAPHNPGVRAPAPQPDQRTALVATGEAEETHWYLSAKRFEITFRVYSIRPADYDGIDIKALQDFLVHAQIIPNDKWNVLSGRVVSCKAATAQDEKTEIEIVAFD